MISKIVQGPSITRVSLNVGGWWRKMAWAVTKDGLGIDRTRKAEAATIDDRRCVAFTEREKSFR